MLIHLCDICYSRLWEFRNEKTLSSLPRFTLDKLSILAFLRNNSNSNYTNALSHRKEMLLPDIPQFNFLQQENYPWRQLLTQPLSHLEFGIRDSINVRIANGIQNHHINPESIIGYETRTENCPFYGRLAVLYLSVFL